MHATEREHYILELLSERGFISFLELEKSMDASSATLRRDLRRLAGLGRLIRMRGGAQLPFPNISPGAQKAGTGLLGVPFHENVARNAVSKAAIGREATKLCERGEAIMIDGGSTTLQMCPHLEGLNLQVLTNSLHIVSALLPQPGTRILVPAGSVFRDQNIILTAAGDENMPRFHAPKLFMGAASLGMQGVMQADILLVAAERRLIERADQIIVLADSSKFAGPSGNVVCELSEINIIVTDAGISDHHASVIERSGVKLIIAQ